MLIGYIRATHAEGQDCLDLQQQAMLAAGVEGSRIFSDMIARKGDACPGLFSCMKALQAGDVLVVWELERLSHNLTSVVGLVANLFGRLVGLRTLGEPRSPIDTMGPHGHSTIAIFVALSGLDRELGHQQIVQGTLGEGLPRTSRRGRKRALTEAQVQMAQEAMANPETEIPKLCRELGIKPATLYKYVDPKGKLRKHGRVDTAF